MQHSSSNEVNGTTKKGGLVVRMAISRKKKEETVEKTRQQLEGCQLVAGIKYTGLTVKQMQQLRQALPQDTTLMVAKNKLIGKPAPNPNPLKSSIAPTNLLILGLLPPR